MGNLLTLLHHTMIIERLTGVAVYFAVVMLAFSYLRKAQNDKQVLRVFRVVVIVLGIMAFFYIPGITADLHRWRQIMIDWKNLPFSGFYRIYLRHASTPCAYLLMYFVEKVGIQGLLPAIVCVGYFAAVFDVMYTEYQRTEVSSFALAHAFLFFMAAGSFLEVISGIRCFLALSITAWCIYQETVCERKLIKNALLYLIACTLHLAAILVVAVRIGYLFLSYTNKKGVRIGDIMMAAAICTAGLLFGKKYILATIDKGSTYLTHEMYDYVWEYLIGGICLLIIFVTLAEFRNMRHEPVYGQLKTLAGFCLLMAVVEVCFCFEYSIFHRFVMFNTILIIPIICAVIDDHMKKRRAGYINMLRLLSFAVLLLASTRGNLCGYKFFLLH